MLLVAMILTLVQVMETTCSARRMRQEYMLLNDGHRIPSLAFGTAQNVSDLDALVPALTYAIQVGFRHLDTAHMYATEHLIGRVLADVFRRRIVIREDMYITTKLDMKVYSREMVVPSLRRNLRRLRLDYVDLFLIHTPFNVFDYPNYDLINIWKGMEDAKMLNLTKSIGVSTFNSSDINRLLRHAKIRPAVNQIEVQLTYTNLDLVAYCQSQGMVVMAFGPFGFLVPRRLNFTVPPTFGNPILTGTARKYGKQPSQIPIRYSFDVTYLDVPEIRIIILKHESQHYQTIMALRVGSMAPDDTKMNRGLLPITKSLNRAHILSNVDIFDFSLSQDEVLTLNEFNRNIPVYVITKESSREFYESIESVVPMLL